MCTLKEVEKCWLNKMILNKTSNANRVSGNAQMDFMNVYLSKHRLERRDCFINKTQN